MPEPLVRPIRTPAARTCRSPPVPTLSQVAAEAAFDSHAEMDKVKRGYQDNRRILIKGLPQAGVSIRSCRRTARSISMRMCRSSLTTVWRSPANAGSGACRGDIGRRFRSRSWRSVSRPFPTRARPMTCRRGTDHAVAGAEGDDRTSRRKRWMAVRAFLIIFWTCVVAAAKGARPPTSTRRCSDGLESASRISRRPAPARSAASSLRDRTERQPRQRARRRVIDITGAFSPARQGVGVQTTWPMFLLQQARLRFPAQHRRRGLMKACG